jgi:hypothetical protein
MLEETGKGSSAKVLKEGGGGWNSSAAGRCSGQHIRVLIAINKAWESFGANFVFDQ